MQITISKARIEDAPILTHIAVTAKRHWNYPEQYYEIWKDELTIAPEYIKRNTCFMASRQDVIMGFYSIAENPDDFYSGDVLVKKGFWLEHIFVLPEYHGKGTGTHLIGHAKEFCKTSGIDKLMIFVDPMAEGFYKKSGAIYSYTSKSSIPDRQIPVYELQVT